MSSTPPRAFRDRRANTVDKYSVCSPGASTYTKAPATCVANGQFPAAAQEHL